MGSFDQHDVDLGAGGQFGDVLGDDDEAVRAGKMRHQVRAGATDLGDMAPVVPAAQELAPSGGRPQGAGTVDGVPVVTLPGNPVSAFVSFEVFVRPALRRALGYTSPDRLHAPARLTGPLNSPAGKRQFLRGRYSGGEVSQVGGPGSHLVAHLARANCLVVVPEDVTELSDGADVDVVLIEGAHQ